MNPLPRRIMHHRPQKGSGWPNFLALQTRIELQRSPAKLAKTRQTPRFRSVRYLGVRNYVDLEQPFVHEPKDPRAGQKGFQRFDTKTGLPAVLFAFGAERERQSPSTRPADL